MIILRVKYFSRRDKFPDNLRNEFEPDTKTLGGKKIVIRTKPSNEFTKQYNTSTNTIRSKVDEYIKELRKNPLSRFEDAGNSMADTHYLADYSNTATNKIEERSVVFSKQLTKGDRFNYRIYRPKLVEEDGETYYIQDIVLCTCWDHTLDGKPGSYVKGQTGNTWHPKSKSTRNKLKEKKKSNKK